MKLHLDPRPVLFAMTTVLSTIVIHFPSLRCQQTLPFDICGQSVQCGDKNFEYPFWGLDRPAYCGHPGFQLTCQSDVPELLFESVKYRVLDHDSSTDTITVARNDFWNTICPQYLHNTTYDSTVFNGDNFNQQNVSLFYGCASSPTGTFPLAPDYRFQCTVNETTSDSYFITGAVTTNITNVTGQCTIIVTADQSRADRLATPPATDNVDCTVNGNRSDSYFTTASVSNDITNLSVQCNSSITVPVERSQADRLATPAATDDDLRSALREGFKLQWIANNDNCDRCVRSGGRCGSNSTSPEVFACYCASGNFSLTCNNIYVVSGGGDSKKSTSLGIVLGIIGVVIAILVIGFGIFVCRRRRKRRGVPGVAVDQIEIFIRNYGTLAPKRYRYPEIKKMTNSFLEKLGQGGYGSVYKGQLPDGRRVAVKLLSEATGNGEDFINEVASISRTSHVNIVTLLGFCFEGKKRALLYEFMPNGSLDKFLHDDDFHLDWDTLFQIAKGIARGLEYLHRGCNTRIVHFDIKPHNILLDKEFVPKISDFGLAKLCRTKESVVSVMGARGTAGYMAPEVFFRSFGGASHKSDVYSYGMMVLEMTGACKYNKAGRTSTSETYFPDWIYKQIEVGGNLGDNGVTTKEEDELARKMMMVSLWCIQTDPSDRPSISKVVEMLEGSFESLHVPPRRFESSPPRPVQGTPSSFVQSSSGDKSIHRAGNDFST